MDYHKEVWAVTANTDTIEGKGNQYEIGIYFTNEDAAVRFACSDHYKRHVCMGVINPEYAKYNVRKVKVPMNIFDSFEQYEKHVVDVQTRRKEIQKQLESMSDLDKELLKGMLDKC